MNKHTSRELSKFLSGLIAGDFLFGLWFYFSAYTSVTFLGMSFNRPAITAWLIFDVVLFIFLVHYAWHMPERPRTKNEKGFHMAIGIVFTIVALLHLSRIVFGWDFNLGSWDVPYWLNGVGTLITAFFAYVSFSLAKQE
jgi:hypothetical protein